MRKWIAIGLVALAGAGWWVPSRRVKLYAQTVPATVHPQWTPNPASENVVQYVITLDGINPVTVLASACSATLCSAAVSVPAFGSHVSSLIAQNLLISTDPTSVQSSLPATLTWSLNQTGTRPTGLTVRP